MLRDPISNTTVKAETRRRFLNTALGGGIIGWIASVMYPVVRYLKPPPETGPNVESVVGAEVDEMVPNSGRVIRFGNKPVNLIRTDSGDFRAFSAICTHLECTVQYRPDLKHIWCACHNGHYDLTGRNIAGPPPRPLAPYEVNISDGKVVVAKPRES